jgi:hypothetical protein
MGAQYQRLIVEQVEFYWDFHFWPRLAGLTDDELFWEPVDGCWSVRPGPDGAMVADGQSWPPAPPPEPFTTIAWRLEHLGTGVFYNRAHDFYGVEKPALPRTAEEFLAYVAGGYRAWHDNVVADEDLERPLGPKGGPYAKDPIIALVVHLNREMMHHGGEIGVLRDLYRAGKR